MHTRPFGPARRDVVLIGQGTWQMERDDRRGCIDALRRGLDLGLTHVDTAELYGYGRVEELVGEAIAGRRDEVFLVSKVLPQNASVQGTIEACERSLRRLATDRLDCYLLHWEGSHPLEETLRAFDRLRDAGKIASYGVSNFDATLLAEAVRLAGPGRIACNQVLYHLGERHVEQALLPACRERGVALVGYSPFGSGEFPEAGSAGREALDEVAREHGATARQVALAFLVRLEGTFTIPKASRAPHVEDNAAAGSLALTDAQIARIDAAFPVRVRRSLPTI